MCNHGHYVYLNLDVNFRRQKSGTLEQKCSTIFPDPSDKRLRHGKSGYETIPKLVSAPTPPLPPHLIHPSHTHITSLLLRLIYADTNVQFNSGDGGDGGAGNTQRGPVEGNTQRGPEAGNTQRGPEAGNTQQGAPGRRGEAAADRLPRGAECDAGGRHHGRPPV